MWIFRILYKKKLKIRTKLKKSYQRKNLIYENKPPTQRENSENNEEEIQNINNNENKEDKIDE